MGTISSLLLSGCLLCLAQPAEMWKAGVARTEITPESPMWLAGYASRDHESEGTLHPLWVKALALEDAEGHRAVMVTSDLLGFPKAMSDRIRDRLRASLQLERNQILLNSSHTHSGPVLEGSLTCIYPIGAAGLERIAAYAPVLEDKVVATVEAAFKDLAPARLYAGNGVTRFAVNRRNNNEAQIQEASEIKGPIDHAVPVIRVEGADGATRALLLGYACHCTTLCEYQWCGDYPGFAQIELEQGFPGVTVMFAAGCSADQNPLPRRSVALARQYGRELAAAVARVAEEPMQALDPVLKTSYREIDVPLSDPPTREQLVEIGKKGPDYVRRSTDAMIAELDAGRPLRTSYPYPVQVWRLGKQNLVALGGEVVVDYAGFIKTLLGRDTFVFGYSNDVMAYIPSERVLAEGGYEGDTSQMAYGMPAKWRPGIEQIIMDGVRALAAEAGALAQ